MSQGNEKDPANGASLLPPIGLTGAFDAPATSKRRIKKLKSKAKQKLPGSSSQPLGDSEKSENSQKKDQPDKRKLFLALGVLLALSLTSLAIVIALFNMGGGQATINAKVSGISIILGGAFAAFVSIFYLLFKSLKGIIMFIVLVFAVIFIGKQVIFNETSEHPVIAADQAPGLAALLLNAPKMSGTTSARKYANPASTPSSPSAMSHARGLTDRVHFQAWLLTLDSDRRRGAEWWLAHRLEFWAHQPGGEWEMSKEVVSGEACRAALPPEEVSGCLEALNVLTTSDRILLKDEDYLSGWEEFSPPPNGTSPPQPTRGSK